MTDSTTCRVMDGIDDRGRHTDHDHLAKALAPRELRDRASSPGGAAIAVGGRETYGDSDGIDDVYQGDRS